MIEQRSGCKVGWEVYDNEAEALAASEREAKARERMFAQGYDFGFLWPGSVSHSIHPEKGEIWTVVTT